MHSWVKLSHLYYQVHRRLKVSVKLCEVKVDSGLVVVLQVWVDRGHLDQAGLWVGEDLAVTLHAEAELAVLDVTRGAEHRIEEDIHCVWVFLFFNL